MLERYVQRLSESVKAIGADRRLGHVVAGASLIALFLMSRIRGEVLEGSSIPQEALGLDGDA